MKRGRRILLILLACGLVAVAALVWPREREPVYQGRALSEWIAGIEGWGDSKWSWEECERGREAVRRQIGTNAIPFLVRCISCEHVAWQEKLAAVTRRLPSGLYQTRIVRSLDGRGKTFRSVLGIAGFQILGPYGRPAIPELVRLTNGAKTQEGSYGAFMALLAACEGGIPREVLDEKTGYRTLLHDR